MAAARTTAAEAPTNSVYRAMAALANQAAYGRPAEQAHAQRGGDARDNGHVHRC
jgi:hypothetical protein